MKRLRRFLAEWVEIVVFCLTLFLLAGICVAFTALLILLGLYFGGPVLALVLPLLVVTGVSAWLNSAASRPR